MQFINSLACYLSFIVLYVKRIMNSIYVNVVKGSKWFMNKITPRPKTCGRHKRETTIAKRV